MSEMDPCLSRIRLGTATLPGILEDLVRLDPQVPFLTAGGITLTRDGFAARTVQLANVLHDFGVKAGDRVLLIAENDVMHPLTLFACSHLRAIFTPVNPAFRHSELSYVVEHSAAKLAIVSVSHEALVRHVVDEAQTDTLITVFDHTSPPSRPDETSLEVRIEEAETTPQFSVEVEQDDTCCIIFTSGTTGNPKGVMHSHRNFVLSGFANKKRLNLSQIDKILVILPFFHVNALFYSLSGAISSAAQLVLSRRFSATTFWQDCVREGVTTVNIIESIAAILLARPESEFCGNHCLRIVYGVRARFEAEFKLRFGVKSTVSGFGMTEVPGVTCTSPDEVNYHGSIGRPLLFPEEPSLNVECKVLNEIGEELFDEAVGEFCVRAPTLMQGYFRNVEATGEAVQNGWLHTGDLVSRHTDGTYQFVSRKKDIIRRRGENVSAAEIETLLREHESIAEAAAIAVPSEMGEDDIFAVIVPVSGARPTAEEVGEWCRARISRTKVPRYIVFVESLPYTATHKIAKQALRLDTSLLKRADDIESKRRTGTNHGN